LISGSGADILAHGATSLYIDQQSQVLVYERGGYIFAVNFSPSRSYTAYPMTVRTYGEYQVILSTDDSAFGGWERISKSYEYRATPFADGRLGFSIYLPARTALVMQKIKAEKVSHADET
jgi:1,4-alpha-glucan branching enzyme